MQQFTDIMNLLRKLVLAFLLAMSTPSFNTQQKAESLKELLTETTKRLFKHYFVTLFSKSTKKDK